MVLTELTKITGPGIRTDTNWVGNNANYTGILTATSLAGIGNLNVTGVTTTGTLFNVGVTTIHSTLIESHNVVSTGVITATTFSGSGASLTNIPAANLTGTLPAIDGSNLTGVSGFSTALSNDTASLLSHIFKTNIQHNIAAGTSVKIESDAGSGNIAFTRLNRINVGTGATLHVGAGTTFLMNVLNIF